MNIKTILNKKFFKKTLMGRLLPFYATCLKRRKFFSVGYKGVSVLLTSLVFDEDISYHHFHASLRAKANFTKDAWEGRSVDSADQATLYIDIGGYNGIFGLLAAKKNSGLKVIIFEPNALNAYVIFANARLNRLNNVFIYEAAVGDEDKDMSLSINKNGSRIAEAGANTMLTRCMTLDSLANSLDNKDLERVVIKIDAEGFEKQCLEGMGDFVKKCGVLDVFISIHSHLIESAYNYCEEDLFKVAENLGLKLTESEKVDRELETHFKK